MATIKDRVERFFATHKSIYSIAEAVVDGNDSLYRDLFAVVNKLPLLYVVDNFSQVTYSVQWKRKVLPFWGNDLIFNDCVEYTKRNPNEWTTRVVPAGKTIDGTQLKPGDRVAVKNGYTIYETKS